jgi:hypothetical protein
MSKLNVVSMGEFRELRELRRSGEGYGRYLSTLGDSQLGTETNFLLDEFSNGAYGKDYSQKVQMVLEEIASRADTTCRKTIRDLNSDTLRLL